MPGKKCMIKKKKSSSSIIIAFLRSSFSNRTVRRMGGGGRQKAVEQLSRSIFFPPPDSMLMCPWARHRTPKLLLVSGSWPLHGSFLPRRSVNGWLCVCVCVCVCVQAFEGSKQMQSIYGNSRGAVLLMVMIMSHEQRRKAPPFWLISFFLNIFFFTAFHKTCLRPAECTSILCALMSDLSGSHFLILRVCR